MNDTPRLIEHAFPLEQASLDSVHEKNVRHGHISTLHIWPARRPLAACRAALLATLLPDPGNEKDRQALCEKIGGKVVDEIDEKTGRGKKKTRGGVLHWHGQPKNSDEWNAIQRQKADMDWFREEIRKVYGRAPKVLDPFAGGGAIPLEAMRLGCEATAVDINPVAWFILKCTLEYPQRLAGQTRRLPDFVLEDREFMEAYFKSIPGKEGKPKYRTPKQLADRVRLHFGEQIAKRGKAKAEQAHFLDDHPDWTKDDYAHGEELEADLAWHVRAWGHWVLAEARKELAPYYPTYADWEPIKKGQKVYEKQAMKLVPLKEDGNLDMDQLNGNLDEDYLDDETNPRWVAKPTVAYLWARTVRCKDCGATVPLLKTRWLCKKDKKRVMLKMESLGRGEGVKFEIEDDVSVRGGNAAQKREHDKKIGAGTMSKSGVKCPCCETFMTKNDIKVEGLSAKTDYLGLAVAVDGAKGKEYRLFTEEDKESARISEDVIEEVYRHFPGGIPNEEISIDAKGSTWCVHYGFRTFRSLFTQKQLLVLGVLLRKKVAAEEQLKNDQYETDWVSSIMDYLQLAFNRHVMFQCSLVRWKVDAEAVIDAFARFGLPVLWDFAESNSLGESAGSFSTCLERISVGLDRTINDYYSEPPEIINNSAITHSHRQKYDAVITDPPYYDAISYAAIMDFFYVWDKRGLMVPVSKKQFTKSNAPKWDKETNDGELIDDSKRFDGDKSASKKAYEDGMAQVFINAKSNLLEDGKMVVVFANKQPEAWETLVAAIIKAGFVVDGSWPIQTEMTNRARSIGSSALASSVWITCSIRPVNSIPGWDNRVLEEMRINISEKLRNFWDAGIRGPDFVWAATGPALEAYSKHPIVKKADEPGALMSVAEFLVHARRMVVEFVVGQVLSGEESGRSDMTAADRLDEQTAYYLLHRHDFGMSEAPTGPVILYAVSCGMTDGELVDTWDILTRVGKKSADTDEEDDDPDSDADTSSDSGSKVKLKTWQQRTHKSLGQEAPKGRTVPLIDRVHRLMHLWKAADLVKVDDYIDEHGLRRSDLFKRVVQSLIELSDAGSSERSTLESISNHIGARGAIVQERMKYN